MIIVRHKIHNQILNKVQKTKDAFPCACVTTDRASEKGKRDMLCNYKWNKWIRDVSIVFRGCQAWPLIMMVVMVIACCEKPSMIIAI